MGYYHHPTTIPELIASVSGRHEAILKTGAIPEEWVASPGVLANYLLDVLLVLLHEQEKRRPVIHIGRDCWFDLESKVRITLLKEGPHGAALEFTGDAPMTGSTALRQCWWREIKFKSCLNTTESRCKMADVEVDVDEVRTLPPAEALMARVNWLEEELVRTKSHLEGSIMNNLKHIAELFKLRAKVREDEATIVALNRQVKELTEGRAVINTEVADENKKA